MTLENILFAASVLVKLISVYFLIIAVLFTFKKPRGFGQHAPRMRFAVLAAARNEEAVIAKFVESVRAQNYPRELFDIFVIPNNCTDDTEVAAKNAGAEIISCRGEVRCKGDALQTAFAKLLADKREYDAFCVFDADNIVDEDFLSEMNNAFVSGARVAKGRTEVLNPYSSWVAGCYGIYFRAFNTFFNRPRAACGLSAKLVGTAFAVHRSVLEELGGWNTETIAEDAEFSSQCALAGHRVFWVPKALSLDEAPDSFMVSMKQRRRWCGGVMEVARLNLPELVVDFNENRRAVAFDFMMFSAAPFAQVTGFFLMLASLAVTAASDPSLLLYTALGLAASYVGVALFAAALAATGERWNAQIAKSVLMFPVFMASWLPLLLVSSVTRSTSWAEIKHTGGNAALARAVK